VINLKGLNAHIPYQKFKMETLKDVRDMLKEQDFMIKIYLKDAYFTIPLGANFKKFVRFRGGESIRIPMPDVWSRSNLKDLHKIVEDIDFSVEKVAHKT